MKLSTCVGLVLALGKVALAHHEYWIELAVFDVDTCYAPLKHPRGKPQPFQKNAVSGGQDCINFRYDAQSFLFEEYHFYGPGHGFNEKKEKLGRCDLHYFEGENCEGDDRYLGRVEWINTDKKLRKCQGPPFKDDRRPRSFRMVCCKDTGNDCVPIGKDEDWITKS